MLHKILIILAIQIAVYQSSSALDFGYEGDDGPSHWADSFAKCNGKHQSPININVLEVQETPFTELNRSNFYNTPLKAKILNNGHTVVVRFLYPENEYPRISNGPLATLNASFIFSQFHFHWGENDTIGSEDRINNVTFPAELHIVFRNEKYKNFNEATKHPNSFVVLAYFFKITPNDNKNYEEFTDLLDEIREPFTEADFKKPPSLRSLINGDHHSYYCYTGSLTTPPCSEEVIWLDFIEPIAISPKQIARFRQLCSAPGVPLMNNFRPVQPLNDRIVHKARLIPNFARDDNHGIPFVTFNTAHASLKMPMPFATTCAALFFYIFFNKFCSIY